MSLLKRIGHWILFLIGGYLFTCLVLAILTVLPVYIGFSLMISSSTFWFTFIVAIMSGIYYVLGTGILMKYLEFISYYKPDYWVSNIFLIIVTLLFYYIHYNFVYSTFYKDMPMRLFF